MTPEAEGNMTITQHNSDLPNTFWTAKDVELATSGSWVIPPAEGWAATGLSIFAPALKPGNMAVVRTETDKNGLLLSVALRLNPAPACLITTAPELISATHLPILKIADGTEAILNMGRYARNKMQGKVIGVTGSAGKTTSVAMIADALAAWGPTCKSSHNANLPRGVAWNIASMPWDTPHVVMEMAIGRMGVSSRMVRPHLAVFTNIQPAHLGENSTIHDIALTKSGIFFGMDADGIAILNRDMLEWETVNAAAEAKQLKIINYGAHPDSDVRLVEYDGERQRVTAHIAGETLSFTLAAGGKHMALNSLAVLATVNALGLPLAPAVARLENFTALAGRGEEKAVTFNGQRLTMIDDAYNANPGSMQAALERLSEQQCSGRRIAILGAMAELGPGAESYHTDLAPLLNNSRIDRIYTVGELFKPCHELLSAEKKGAWVATPDELKALLPEALQEGDTVLFKGSNSTGIHQLVSWINAESDK